MTAEYVIVITPSAAQAGHLDVTVRTVRQFSSFGYSIALTAAMSHEKGQGFVIDVGGITLPPVTKQAEGPAVSVVTLPLPLRGDLHVTVRRKDVSVALNVQVANGTLIGVEVEDPSELFLVEPLTS